MNRPVLLIAMPLLAAALSLPACDTPRRTAPSGKPGARPNLVLIIIDTLRADRMSCYGFGEETTPGLDALAGRGARFARVIAPSSQQTGSTS